MASIYNKRELVVHLDSLTFERDEENRCDWRRND